MQESLPGGGTPDPTVAADLIEMAAQDQAMRRQDLHDRAAWDAWEAVDREHQRRLGDILDRWGWPTIALVGAEASQAAWLLAQHAPDLAFMERGLELMLHLPSESNSSGSYRLPPGSCSDASWRTTGLWHAICGYRWHPPCPSDRGSRPPRWASRCGGVRA